MLIFEFFPAALALLSIGVAIHLLLQNRRADPDRSRQGDDGTPDGASRE
ncbi:MAG: hypothetical protein AB7G23_12490 [Vicinamibacterales bacterium]